MAIPRIGCRIERAELAIERCFVKIVCSFLVAVFVAYAGSARAADVLVVDGSGGGAPFLSVQAAIDAAAPGDVILIRSGHYDGITIDGKGVTLIADAGADVTIGGYIPNSPLPPTANVVQNVPVGQAAVLDGITFHGYVVVAGSGGVFYVPALFLSSNAGQLWIERCDTDGTRPLEMESCAGVTVHRCDLTAISPALGSGVEVRSSSVTISDTTVIGAPGRDAGPNLFGFYSQGSEGGAGLTVSYDSAVVISGSTIRGGQGGDGLVLPFAPFCVDARNGGAGLVANPSTPNAVIRTIDSTIDGGLPGSGGCLPASQGPAMSPSNAQVIAWNGAVLTLEVSSPLREGQVGSLTIGDGAVGTSVLLILGTMPSSLVIPAGLGTSFVALPWTIVGLGTMSGSTLSFSTTAPQLPPGVAGIAVPLQAAGCVGAQCVLGGGSALVLIDSSF